MIDYDAQDANHSGTSVPTRMRLVVFSVLFSLAALAVFVRYAVVMTAPELRDTGTETRVALERGPILDRNGRILALQTRLGNITLWRPEAGDAASLSLELQPILETDAREIEDRINTASSEFIYLRKGVDQSTIRQIEQLKAEGRLKGVEIEPVMGRVYPENRLAGPLIGFVGDGNQGLAGIEYAYDGDLAPAGGAVYGNQVLLTIDAKVQHILEEISRRTLVENEAEAVMLIAMDPRNGDILGYASLPDFDPNDIRTSDERSRIDRPAIWAYEPGSVFKIFSLAAIMDLGGIDEQSAFVCDGTYEQTTGTGEKVAIKCLGTHGTVHAREIITYSCNAGAAYASDQVDAASFYARLRDFGFGSRTGAGNPGETAGYLRPVDRWSRRSKPTIAIGQEIAVSALQMLQAATAIANDGILVTPRVVARVLANDGTVLKDLADQPSRRVLAAETARAIRSYMVDASSEAGTGRRANVADVPMAVKTGTAQLVDPGTGKYSDTDFIASTMAILPADDPSLVLYHVIVKPKGSSYLGGRIAAPPIREAAEALVDYLGIPRGRNPQATHPPSVVLGKDEIPELGSVMPDLRGFSKRQILPLLLRDDITIQIHGEGWVRSQTPAAGSPLIPGQMITLDLE